MNKMKTKILMLLCLVCTAFCATSCLNNDDNGSTYVPLTPAEKHVICVETSGSYNGYVYDLQKKDSTAVTFIVQDSLLTMNNFPVKSISPYVNDVNAKNVLANAPAAEVKFNFNGFEIQQTSDATGNYYGLWMIPAYTYDNSSKCYKFSTSYTDANGKGHSIEINFADGIIINGYTYYAVANYQSRKIKANIFVYSVVVDGSAYSVVDNNSYAAGKAFIMNATKLGY